MKIFKKGIFKYASIYVFSGCLYVLMELLYRQKSDITMFFLAGLCGLVLMGLNNFYTYELDFALQVFISSVFITIGEYLFGIIFNQDFHIWNYSSLPFNLHGQICLYYCVVWIVLSAVGIPLLDYIEWKVFKYKEDTAPYYKIFNRIIFRMN